MTVALVTGANRGIGLEFCRQLRARGDEVVAVCRKASPELRKLDVEVVEGVDITDASHVAALASKLAGKKLDLLINNAGILDGDSLEALDFSALNRQMEVNAWGPLRVTHALLPNLTKGSKIALITSRMGSIGDNGSGGYYGYRMSKAALNMAGVSLARDLGPRGIAVGILHPGMVRTQMTSDHGTLTPAEAVAGLLARIDELSLDTTGSFRHGNGEALPW
ncbi:MAG TPA: SDR family oxidoreductase [Polyangiaceae bacterium]|jgi:NAD(P)-dependent dehydrogenase (short-subunit alcohol dehydrogenase family)